MSVSFSSASMVRYQTWNFWHLINGTSEYFSFTVTSVWVKFYIFSQSHSCTCAKLLRSSLFDPMNCSPPGSSVPGIIQAKILEWVAMSSSRESSWPGDGTHDFYLCLHWQVGSLLLVPPGKSPKPSTYPLIWTICFSLTFSLGFCSFSIFSPIFSLIFWLCL